MRTASVVFGLAAILGVAIAACSEEAARAPAKGPGTSSGGSFEDDDGGAGDACSDAAKLVYVLSLEGDLHSFDPAKKAFAKVGKVTCPSAIEIRPVSMAVDRNAVAWVNMVDVQGQNALFQLDTKTAKCSSSTIKGGMGGMGFSTEGRTTSETLFVTGLGTRPENPGLKKVDFAASAIVPVADIAVEAELELTGTGDGRLYGFVSSAPAALATIDKATGAVSDAVTLTDLPPRQDPLFAFAFWGGDFYFFTATGVGPNETSDVARLTPGGTLETSYMSAIGFHVVGAGVSTCAPIVTPR